MFENNMVVQTEQSDNLLFLLAYCNVFNVQEENEVYEINSEIKSKAARSLKNCQHGKRLNSL